MAAYSQESILKAVRDNGVRFISLQFTDIMGTVKTITVPTSQLVNVMDNGIWFDGSSIQGFVRISESDMFLRPDLNTFAIIPWLNDSHGTARFICDVFTPGGELFVGAPRTILSRAMDEARAMGLEYRVGPELEFFLFGTDESGAPIPGATHDEAGYFDLTADRGALVRDDMITALEPFGIDVEAGHHEVANGQHEIDFRYGDALTTADAAVTFKYVLKAIARQHRVYATFMPKPVRGINGSGMHVNQSLFRNGTNLFFDPQAPYQLSQDCLHYIGGLMHHAKAFTAFTNPLVNSFKRLVPGFEAPVYVSWAEKNRSPMIRIPASRGKGTRVEVRSPDPSCNPYLAIGLMLCAGLDGLEKRLDPGPPMSCNLYDLSAEERNGLGIPTLPGNLIDALDEFERDDVLKQAVGPHIWNQFLAAKQVEWDTYRCQVHPWELERYLSTY